MKYICPICKSNSDIHFYFSNTKIIKNPDFLDPDRIDYYAQTGITGICPYCGYLIKDNIATSIKYYFKDMGYDLKAVKDKRNIFI